MKAGGPPTNPQKKGKKETRMSLWKPGDRRSTHKKKGKKETRMGLWERTEGNRKKRWWRDGGRFILPLVCEWLLCSLLMNQCQVGALICWPSSFSDLGVSYTASPQLFRILLTPVRGSSSSKVLNAYLYPYTSRLRVIVLHLGSAVSRCLHESSERVR